ncbi:hypothetical protein [Niabella sp.]|uniref:hypothetical protein n=1 Tax=Niabella sp. TaxID=1962976 RepID=UPI00261510BD|nr:hypothetical protein [Niabella sp.]
MHSIKPLFNYVQTNEIPFLLYRHFMPGIYVSACGGAGADKSGGMQRQSVGVTPVRSFAGLFCYAKITSDLVKSVVGTYRLFYKF